MCLFLQASHVGSGPGFLSPTYSVDAACQRTGSALLTASWGRRSCQERKLIAWKRRTAGAATAGGAEPEQLSSVGQSSVNLVKNIVGSGMLSLPAGVAAYSASPKGLVPALACALLLALLSAYGFVLTGDACKRTEESSYAGAWAKTVSPGTTWLPTVACLAKASIGCISFSMILGDCLALILRPMGLPPAISTRSPAMLAITGFVLLPLCNMKSLAPLAKFSVLGVLSNVYICFFIGLRCIDGTYGHLTGAYSSLAPVQPSFAAFSGSAWGTMLHPGFSVLTSILATAFLAHYNAPLFYKQLAPGLDGKKEGRFALVSVLGFGAAGTIFALVMAGGFLTFGANCLGLILNNYAATDRLAVLARFAIALSLVTSYPLAFQGARMYVIDLLGERGKAMAAAQPFLFTLSMLGAITLVALNLTDLGRLAAFAGACFGSFLIYIAPALMVLRAQKRGLGPRPGGARGFLGRLLMRMLIPLGAALGCIGAVTSLS